MENFFQIFGSESSLDLDVIIFVTTLTKIYEASQVCKTFTDQIQKEFENTEKKVNVNLAVLDTDYHRLCEVYKGTVDELNNSLYQTNRLHPQFYPNQIECLMVRDIKLKKRRVARKVLELLTRTQFRIPVKNALRSDFKSQLDSLDLLKLTEIVDLGKNGELLEFY